MAYPLAERKAMKTAKLNSTPVAGKFTWVSEGAILKCKFGTAPSKLKVDMKSTYLKSEGKWLATINDYKPTKNIMPFGKCTKKSPSVPCKPATVPFWTPMVPTRKAGKPEYPALAYPNATLTCTTGGSDCIMVKQPGQTKQKVDHPQEKGCFEKEIHKYTENTGNGTSTTHELGKVKACMNEKGLTFEVTGAKSTTMNGTGQFMSAESLSTSFKGGPGVTPNGSAHFVQFTGGATGKTGTAAYSGGIGIAGGSKKGFGLTYGPSYTMP